MKEIYYCYILSNKSGTVLYEAKEEAKSRERQLKNWHKEWKWNLIKKENPDLLIIELKN